jgi:hypothetical protein
MNNLNEIDSLIATDFYYRASVLLDGELLPGGGSSPAIWIFMSARSKPAPVTTRPASPKID